MLIFISPIPSVGITAKSLGTMKVNAQKREYVKNVERMVLTTQNPPANNLNMLTAKEITQLTLYSVQHSVTANSLKSQNGTLFLHV